MNLYYSFKFKYILVKSVLFYSVHFSFWKLPIFPLVMGNKYSLYISKRMSTVCGQLCLGAPDYHPFSTVYKMCQFCTDGPPGPCYLGHSNTFTLSCHFYPGPVSVCLVFVKFLSFTNASNVLALIQQVKITKTIIIDTI